jgi:hypothetical protein
MAKRPKPQTLADLRGLLGVSPAHVAPILGMSRGACYTCCERGELPCHRFGRRVVIDVPALLRMFSADDS